jgi:diaminopimelate epimerase
MIVGDRLVNISYDEAKDLATVNLGTIGFQEGWMPKEHDLWNVAKEYDLSPKEILCVDVGNPHLVIFAQLTPEEKNLIGHSLQGHQLFPEGVNVNFAHIMDGVIYLEVFERGAGMTLACGSGACATFAAAEKMGFASDSGIIRFKLGDLSMQKMKNDILMTGPASYVFAGEYYYQ